MLGRKIASLINIAPSLNFHLTDYTHLLFCPINREGPSLIDFCLRTNEKTFTKCENDPQIGSRSIGPNHPRSHQWGLCVWLSYVMTKTSKR